MGRFQRAVQGLLLAGICLVFGCTPLSRLTTTGPESAPPKSVDLGELVQSLAQRLDRFRSLRALATVYYWAADGRGGFQEAILVERPNRMRLETLSPLGAVLIVTVDADELIGFHPREGLFYRGRSSKENLERLTQIPLELEEITALLIGVPPVEPRARWEREGESIYRDLDGGTRETVAFDPRLGVPIKWERLDPYGRPKLSAHFSDFSPTPAGYFPLKISLEAHDQQTRLEIRYQEPEVNAALPPALFVQERPANVKEIPIESLGG